MDGTWYLDNVEDRARESPRAFFIPPEQRRHNLQEGDTVKLVFMLNHPSEHEPEAERMWVDVIRADGTSYTGSLLNTPDAIRDLKLGDEVTFGPEHVAAVGVNEAEIGYAVEERALVSRRLAAKDVRPGLLSRDEPVEEGDSGWTLMLGDEPQSFYEDAENFGTTNLGFLTDKFPELEKSFEKPVPVTSGDGTNKRGNTVARIPIRPSSLPPRSQPKGTDRRRNLFYSLPGRLLAVSKPFRRHRNKSAPDDRANRRLFLRNTV